MKMYSLHWTRWTRSEWTVWQQNLEDCGYAKESVEKYLQLFKEITGDVEGVRYCKEKLEGFLKDEAAASLEHDYHERRQSQKNADFRITFDPTLVRGMSYYTGTIFRNLHG